MSLENPFNKTLASECERLSRSVAIYSSKIQISIKEANKAIVAISTSQCLGAMSTLGAMKKSSLLVRDKQLGGNRLTGPLAASCVILNQSLLDPAAEVSQYDRERWIRSVWNHSIEVAGLPVTAASLIILYCYETVMEDLASSYLDSARRLLREPKVLLTEIRKKLQSGGSDLSLDVVARIAPYAREPSPDQKDVKDQTVLEVFVNKLGEAIWSIYTAVRMNNAVKVSAEALKAVRSRSMRLGVSKSFERQLARERDRKELPKLEPSPEAKNLISLSPPPISKLSLETGGRRSSVWSPEDFAAEFEKALGGESKLSGKSMGGIAADDIALVREADIEAMQIMATPPRHVLKVMECVCLLLGREPPNWITARTLLGYYNDEDDPRPFLDKFRSAVPSLISVSHAIMMKPLMKKINHDEIDDEAGEAQASSITDPAREDHWKCVARALNGACHLARALEKAWVDIEKTVLPRATEAYAAALWPLEPAYRSLRGATAPTDSLEARMQALSSLLSCPEPSPPKDYQKKKIQNMKLSKLELAKRLLKRTGSMENGGAEASTVAWEEVMSKPGRSKLTRSDSGSRLRGQRNSGSHMTPPPSNRRKRFGSNSPIKSKEKKRASSKPSSPRGRYSAATYASSRKSSPKPSSRKSIGNRSKTMKKKTTRTSSSPPSARRAFLSGSSKSLTNIITKKAKKPTVKRPSTPTARRIKRKPLYSPRARKNVPSDPRTPIRGVSVDNPLGFGSSPIAADPKETPSTRPSHKEARARSAEPKLTEPVRAYKMHLYEEAKFLRRQILSMQSRLQDIKDNLKEIATPPKK